jgi:hypothetical protein
MPWFMILMWILLKSPEIYRLVKWILEMIRAFKDQKLKEHYDYKLRLLVKERLDGKKLKVTNELMALAQEIQGKL